MKAAIRNGTVMALSITTAAYASNGVESSGVSLLMWIFFFFVGCIIVMQLVPGMTLFFGMLKGIFSTLKREEVVTKAKGNE